LVRNPHSTWRRYFDQATQLPLGRYSIQRALGLVSAQISSRIRTPRYIGLDYVLMMLWIDKGAIVKGGAFW
jgi:hypothetical protein